MALATQCPHCYTSFRVANDQLKLHAGLVRCGACKQTFNGIEHLLAPGATPKSPPSKTSDTENSAALGDTPDTSQSDTQNTTNAVDAETEANSHTHENPTAHVADQVEEASVSYAAKVNSLADHQNGDAHEPESISETTPALETQLPTQTDTSEVSTEDSALAANLETRAQTESEDLTTALAAEPNETSEPPERDSYLIDSPSETSEQVFPEVNADLAAAETDLDENLDVDLTEVDSSDSEQEIVENKADSTEVEISNPLTTNTARTHDAETQTTSQISDNSSSEPEISEETNKQLKKPGALTASLDFELSKEDQAWADDITQVKQLELETRAAVLDETSDAWSKHEQQSAQDGFIDSLKDLKPIFDDIGDFGSVRHHSPLNSDDPLQSLDDLRINDSKTDSLSDQELDLDLNVDTKDDEVTPAFVLQAERAQRFGKWKKIGLSVTAFLFVLLGVAQSIYFLRSDIAAQFPQFKPQLLSVCKVLSCQIKLPAQKSMLEITGSELLIVNEELSMNTLSVQIQNKSNTLQAWPHFDLTLKDRRGKDLLQKAFTPAQYLENKDLLNKGMAANSESNHKIFFQLNGLKASDYTVEIFYP